MSWTKWWGPGWLLGAVLACLLLAGPAQAGIVVSMGDSYSSGEAAGPYDPETDKGPIGGTNRCHRSERAWPRLMGVEKGYHLACSGATTQNFDKTQGYTAPDHVGQLQRLGEIVATTTVDRVLVGIGGNDLGFAKIIRSCRFSARACLQNMHKIDLPHLRTNVRTAVKNGLQSIRRTVGPRAEIVLVGYPDIMPQAGVALHKCRWVDESEDPRMRTLQDELDTNLNIAANEAGARFISIREALRKHELCTKDPWVKPITSAKDAGIRNKQQMAHPTEPGQRAIAALVTDKLSATAGVPVVSPAGCVPAASIAAIVDDSGSMDTNDPQNLRRRALELLITKPGGGDRTLGAVEFGTYANTLFAPGLIAPNQAAMLGALDALRGDESRTDYDEGFALSKIDQPDAQARIFLTDGVHNDGAYSDTHAGGPRTYVIGLDIERTGTEGADRLQRIADETGGAYFPLKLDTSDSPTTQSLRLQPAFNAVDALLECRAAPDQVLQQLNTAGEYGRGTSGRFLGQPSVDIVLSWGTPGTDIDLAAASAKSTTGKVVADLVGATRKNRNRRKLVVNTLEGQTFDTITVARPARATTLTFVIKATTISEPTAVNVQIRPSTETVTGATSVVPPATPPDAGGAPPAAPPAETPSTPPATPAGPDTTAPSQPAGLRLSGATQTSMRLDWDAASDNVGVKTYDAFRGSTRIATIARTFYVFNDLTCGTNYTFGVVAEDDAGNRSGRGTVSGATAACPQPPTPEQPPVQSPAVSLAKGGSAQGQPGCSSSACRFLSVNFANFSAGTHTITCRASNGDENGYYSYTRSGASGSSAVCYYGFPGRSVWVTVDGVASNTVVW